MGCLCTKSGLLEEDVQEAPKTYSWDKREKIDLKDITISDLKGETVGRAPGKLNGQQFIIQNCEDCNIYIFDHSSMITIDDCINCRIFLGPIKGSVFFRDCQDCKCVVACQQFRTRDCKRMDIFLSCQTQPSIEASTGLKFGCYQYYYPELRDQFKSAGLSIFSNSWSKIHDFTPVDGEKNWSLLPKATNVEDYLPMPASDTEFSNILISTALNKSVVPVTEGSRRKTSDQVCLVVFFGENQSPSESRALEFIEKMRSQGSCSLIQTKELILKEEEASRIFGADSKYISTVQAGPVIGLEYSGEDVCGTCCQSLAQALGAGGSSVTVYISPSPEQGAVDIDSFYNFAEIQMAI